MKYTLPPLLLLALALAPCFAADPAPPPIVIPDGPAPPAPAPSSTLTLGADQLLVVRANVDAQVLVSPSTLAKVSRDTGPLRIRAKFTDGTGYECRTFSDKWVFSLEPATSGTGELLVVLPDGTVQRRTLVVGGNPPPGPPPQPPPAPPVDPLTAALQTAYAAEADPAKAVKLADLAALLGVVVTVEKSTGTVTTLSQLQKEIHARADAVAGAGGMPALRKAMNVYLASKLPAVDAPLTDALWAQATAAYGDVAKALKGVKP